MSANNQGIRLKVLAGGCIILAECLGRDSELFYASIINNRITLQNAIVERRCCKEIPNNSLKKIDVSKEKTHHPGRLSTLEKQPLANSTPMKRIPASFKENINISIPNIRKKRITQNKNIAGITSSLPSAITVQLIHRTPTPNTPSKLARVTPLPRTQSSIRVPDSTTRTHSQILQNISNISNFRTSGSLPTPDIIRRAVINNKNTSTCIPTIGPGIKVVRLHRNPTSNTPNKLARVVDSSRIQSPITFSDHTYQTQPLRNLLNVSNFGTPPRLSLTNNVSSPNQSFLLPHTKTPGSVTKWRKCITPQRTYLRRSNTQKQKPMIKSESLSVKKLSIHGNCRVVENFLIPSKYPVGKGVIIRTRKLVVDPVTSIPANEFKKQIKTAALLNRSVKDSHLPKSRKRFMSSHKTAFDLLTNSCYHPRLASKLNTLFRQGCLNKRAATILKYKQLIADIPNLDT